MIALFATLVMVVLLFVNLTGAALLVLPLTRSWLLARVLSPLMIAVPCFFLEHFVGLGSLAGVWPVTTVAAAGLACRGWRRLRENWRVELVFHGGFLYALMWRWAFPNIDAVSEKLADLTLIRNYTTGTMLPPPDVWLPPYRFDVYYAFQHYAAALLGRALGLDLGHTYHLAFCLLVALAITGAAGAAYHFSGSRRVAAAVTVAFVVGGTGASPFVPLMIDRPRLSDSMRFIGGAATPARVTTPFGRWLVSAARVPDRDAAELPSETFSYLVQLGDYHPPLSGLALLTAALCCIALAEAGGAERASQAFLGAALPLAIVSDAWVVPLMASLILAWLAHRGWSRRGMDARALLGGFAATTLLVYPFLLRFAPRTLDYRVTLRWVRGSEHSPWLLALIVLWPAAALLLVFFAQGSRQSLPVWLGLGWTAMLLASELFYVDDVYSGKFNRFNTTLKWWPWIWSGILISTGAFNLRARSRLCRVTTALSLVAVSTYAIALQQHLVTFPRSTAGRLDGAAWLRADPIEAVILEYLATQPRSIVLQRPAAGAFTPAPGLVVFAGHQAFLGWSAHEKLWRGQRADIDQRAEQIQRFYRGELREMREWLVRNHIEHVLWLKEDNAVAGAFQRIDEQIRADYAWREFYVVGEFRVGLWSRRRE